MPITLYKYSIKRRPSRAANHVLLFEIKCFERNFKALLEFTCGNGKHTCYPHFNQIYMYHVECQNYR